MTNETNPALTCTAVRYKAYAGGPKRHGSLTIKIPFFPLTDFVFCGIIKKEVFSAHGPKNRSWPEKFGLICNPFQLFSPVPQLVLPFTSPCGQFCFL